MNNLFTIIPQILIILALAGIVVIVARKFPKLSKISETSNIQKNRTTPIIQRTFKKIIYFSENTVRVIFSKIVKIRNLTKNDLKKEKKEQEQEAESLDLINNKKIRDFGEFSGSPGYRRRWNYRGGIGRYPARAQKRVAFNKCG